METIENTIIQNLVTNEEYTRKVLPFLKPDYFDTVSYTHLTLPTKVTV